MAYLDEEKESRAKMKAYLKHCYNLAKETDHLNFIKKYLGFKSNDEMDDRFKKLKRDGLRGLKGITDQDEILALEKEEQQYFVEKIRKNPIFDVEKDTNVLAKSQEYQERLEAVLLEVEEFRK